MLHFETGLTRQLRNVCRFHLYHRGSSEGRAGGQKPFNQPIRPSNGWSRQPGLFRKQVLGCHLWCSASSELPAGTLCANRNLLFDQLLHSHREVRTLSLPFSRLFEICWRLRTLPGNASALSHSLHGWLVTASLSIPLRLTPSGLVVAGNLERLTFKGSPLSSLTHNSRPWCHAWTWAHYFAPHKFGCTQVHVLLSATSASGGFPFSYPPIETHPLHAFLTSSIDCFSYFWQFYSILWFYLYLGSEA